jgi:hypothetical protein
MYWRKGQDGRGRDFFIRLKENVKSAHELGEGDSEIKDEQNDD